jgi:hypothetical protein
VRSMHDGTNLVLVRVMGIPTLVLDLRFLNPFGWQFARETSSTGTDLSEVYFVCAGTNDWTGMQVRDCFVDRLPA